MIETLIIIYISICASMIVFDCIFMLIMSIRAGGGKGKTQKIMDSLADQLETISEKKELPEKYRISLYLYYYEEKSETSRSVAPF